MPRPVPPPHTGLPVEDVVAEVRAALAGVGAAVLEAEPGAGKTTVVPLRLLDEPWLDGQRIVVLEPRRVAARAAAARLAHLLGEDVGETVGYRTRLDAVVGRTCRIEVVTEGILTRRLQHDPELSGVGLVVFDEFHERSLQADLGLALTLDSRRALRPDLRLLVMSATIEGDRVAAVIGDDAPAPVIRSTGRQFPVDIRWRPRRRQDHLEPSVAAAVREILRTEADGDVLVFLPGAAAIRRTEQELVGVDADVRPLFGALSAHEQDAALAPAPAGRRKIVLATDIAETSLTVEGVRIVVDAGLVRTPKLDPSTGMTTLTTVSHSRASADQRAGRAGRTSPGVAVRLWSKVEHGTRARHTDPEIARVDLAGFVLELAGWGVHDPAELTFLDPPSPRAVDAARELLRSLFALDDDGRITPHGRAMLELPLHPRLAHMVLMAEMEGHGPLGCLLAALLEDRDVLRGRPDEVPVDVDERLALMVDPSRRHPAVDGRAVADARRRAEELARRRGIDRSWHEAVGSGSFEAAGMVLAHAYPDRIARARDGAAGKYLLRSGSGAWLSATDPLARQTFVVAAHLDHDRKEARIRLAAALDPDDLARALATEIDETEMLVWDEARDDLIVRVERRIGAVRLTGHERRPDPGPATVAALLGRVRAKGLGVLQWTPTAIQLRARLRFLHASAPDGWPDVSDAALLSDLDDWLAPHLVDATGRADLDMVSLQEALLGRLGWHRTRELDEAAPTSFTLASGRRLPIDWTGERPTLSSRAQDFYGTVEHPTVAAGRLPLTVELLSPAGRPVQVTADLPGFWSSSWAEVRKEMIGRYPKHDWPADPSTATPPPPGSRPTRGR